MLTERRVEALRETFERLVFSWLMLDFYETFRDWKLRLTLCTSQKKTTFTCDVMTSFSIFKSIIIVVVQSRCFEPNLLIKHWQGLKNSNLICNSIYIWMITITSWKTVVHEINRTRRQRIRAKKYRTFYNKLFVFTNNCVSNRNTLTFLSNSIPSWLRRFSLVSMRSLSTLALKIARNSLEQSTFSAPRKSSW